MPPRACVCQGKHAQEAAAECCLSVLSDEKVVAVQFRSSKARDDFAQALANSPPPPPPPAPATPTKKKFKGGFGTSSSLPPEQQQQPEEEAEAHAGVPAS